MSQPGNTTSSNPAAPLEYQNPGTVAAVLDSEVVGTDSQTGQPTQREFVIPQESVSAYDPLFRIANTLDKILVELKGIRVLAELDAIPELLDGVIEGLETDVELEETNEA